MICRAIGTKKLANDNFFPAGWTAAQCVRFVRGRVGVSPCSEFLAVSYAGPAIRRKAERHHSSAYFYDVIDGIEVPLEEALEKSIVSRLKIQSSARGEASRVAHTLFGLSIMLA